MKKKKNHNFFFISPFFFLLFYPKKKKLKYQIQPQKDKNVIFIIKKKCSYCSIFSFDKDNYYYYVLNTDV